MNCDYCTPVIDQETRCARCRARHTKAQAHADEEMDRLKADGYRSPEQKRIVEEMEERRMYPDGRR